MARGSISKRGSSWRVRYWTPDGKQASKTFGKKVDAEQYLTRQLATIGAGDWVNPAEGKVTFKEYAEEWRAVQPHRIATAQATANRLRLHIYPHIGHRPLGAVRTSEIRALIAKASETLAPRSVEGVLRQVATIFKAAVDDRVIARSPVVKIAVPRPDGHKVVPLAVEDVHAITAALPARYRAAAVVAAGLGLRQGELFGLTVDRVNWLRRTVRVDRQLVSAAGVSARFGPTKTEASVRTIPAPTLVLEALTEHLREFGEGPDRLIFTTAAGGPVRRSTASDRWRAATAKAGVDARGWHDLRHFYASLLIHSGASVKVVQDLLGHKHATETLNTYGHLWPGSENVAREAVDSILGGSRDHSVTIGLAR